jgi:hypothetical protein
MATMKLFPPQEPALTQVLDLLVVILVVPHLRLEFLRVAFAVT